MTRISWEFYGGPSLEIFEWRYLSPYKTQNHIGKLQLCFEVSFEHSDICLGPGVWWLPGVPWFAILARTFVILHWTSVLESSMVVILLPWCSKSLTSSIMFLFAWLRYLYLNWSSSILFLLTFILSPICLFYLSKSLVFLWIPLCPCFNKAMSSAKSGSLGMSRIIVASHKLCVHSISTKRMEKKPVACDDGPGYSSIGLNGGGFYEPIYAEVKE